MVQSHSVISRPGCPPLPSPKAPYCVVKMVLRCLAPLGSHSVPESWLCSRWMGSDPSGCKRWCLDPQRLPKGRKKDKIAFGHINPQGMDDVTFIHPSIHFFVQQESTRPTLCQALCSCQGLKPRGECPVSKAPGARRRQSKFKS